MKDAILEYSEAVQEHIKASQNETMAKDLKKKAYYRLMRAKENLRLMERDMLEETILI